MDRTTSSKLSSSTSPLKITSTQDNGGGVSSPSTATAPTSSTISSNLSTNNYNNNNNCHIQYLTTLIRKHDERETSDLDAVVDIAAATPLIRPSSAPQPSSSVTTAILANDLSQVTHNHKSITGHDIDDDATPIISLDYNKSRINQTTLADGAFSRLTICDKDVVGSRSNNHTAITTNQTATTRFVQRKGIDATSLNNSMIPNVDVTINPLTNTITTRTTGPIINSLTDCDNHVTSLPPHIRILPKKTQSLDIVDDDDDRMSSKCNVINSQTIVGGGLALSPSRSVELAAKGGGSGAVPRLHCSDLMRPIYPSLNYSPYASPFSSPRSGRRRPPLRESRRVSIEHNGSFIFLNQYKLMDEIGQVSGLSAIRFNQIRPCTYSFKGIIWQRQGEKELDIFLLYFKINMNISFPIICQLSNSFVPHQEHLRLYSNNFCLNKL